MQVHSLEKRALENAAATGWPPDELERQLDVWQVPADVHTQLVLAASGAPPRPTVIVDRIVHDEDRLDIPGHDLIAMLTPGHTAGSISLRGDRNALLLTGDVIVPTLHAGLGLGGPTESNSLRDYPSSVSALSAYRQYEVLPGHGYGFVGVADRAKQSANHHLRRSRQVATVLSQGPGASIWDLASRLTWAAGWENLSGFYLYSALTQTAIHREFVQTDGLASSSNG